MNLYSVYGKDDIPIAISRTSAECAKLMGITVGSFHTMYSKQKNGHLTAGKYQIYLDDPMTEEELQEIA